MIEMNVTSDRPPRILRFLILTPIPDPGQMPGQRRLSVAATVALRTLGNDRP